MSGVQARIKILKRIAQATGAQPTVSNTTIPTTSNNTAVPADTSPPATSLYPTIRTGFDSARVVIIDSLAKILSNASNIATNGKYNLQNLKNNNFQFDPSSFNSPD